MSSKYQKKRKANVDEDTSAEGQAFRARKEAEAERERNSSSSPPPPKAKNRKRESSPAGGGGGGGGDAESLSIEETNKLRASLGLAPLDVGDNSKPAEPEPDDEPVPEGVNVIVEDGVKIHHKVAENWGEKKREMTVKEKLEAAKHKRRVEERLLKAKKLAEEDVETDATAWVEQMRKKEEERRKAEERAKMLDEMDADFGVSTLMEEEKDKAARKKARDAMKKRREAQDAITANLLVGHSKAAFASGKDQILVLDDKDVLDDGDEVLVNPNMADDERAKRNTELKKRKDRYRPFDEAYDDAGNPKQQQLLAKYDEDLEGAQRKTFRLNEKGEVDLAEEEEAARAAALREMAGKTLVSLEMEKFKRASEFYTQEEMVAFRKPKKGNKERKTRKKLDKMLKADDLVPLEEEKGGKDKGRRTRGRHGSEGETEEGEEAVKEASEEKKIKSEEGELEEVDDGEGGMIRKGWKKATKGAVDIESLRKLAEREEEEEESEDELLAPTDLAGVVIEDDAEDELYSMLERARRLKEEQARPEMADPEAAAKKVLELVQHHGEGTVKKEEPEEEGDERMEQDDATAAATDKDQEGDVMCIDSTMEYCRNIGELTSYGIVGNRKDTIDTSSIVKEEERKKVKTEEGVDEFESVQKWKRAQAERERRKRLRKEERERASGSKNTRGGWRDESRVDSDDERELAEAADKLKEEEDTTDDEEEYINVLGDESDVRKGVGNMLKLAAQKGYLNDPNAKRQTGQSLEHLQNKRATKLEAERFDIEDKYVKKLERMGTTGSGPVRQFPEKKDYKPDLVIEYVDEKGREMDPKDAFRVMSWKFHGKKPGKKQIEKRSLKIEKREVMKKMDSWDTPLGTLNKQIKKQEQLQTPYILLSSKSRQTELKKE